MDGRERNYDRWELLRIERRLAEELQKASEAFRLANVRMREAAHPEQVGLQFPDSTSESQRARAVWQAAKTAYDRAFAYWMAFVRDGTVPDDL